MQGHTSGQEPTLLDVSPAFVALLGKNQGHLNTHGPCLGLGQWDVWAFFLATEKQEHLVVSRWEARPELGSELAECP